MTFSDIVGAIGAVGSLLAAFIAAATFFRTRTIEGAQKVQAVKAEATHDLVNSLSQERLAAAQTASFKEGRTEGRLGKLEDTAGLPNGGDAAADKPT